MYVGKFVGFSLGLHVCVGFYILRQYTSVGLYVYVCRSLSICKFMQAYVCLYTYVYVSVYVCPFVLYACVCSMSVSVCMWVYVISVFVIEIYSAHFKLCNMVYNSKNLSARGTVPFHFSSSIKKNIYRQMAFVHFGYLFMKALPPSPSSHRSWYLQNFYVRNGQKLIVG